MYQQHPSTRLTALFHERPYQGAAPEEAAFIFIGLDANYAEDLERTPFFSTVHPGTSAIGPAVTAQTSIETRHHKDV